jgi:hypothetical protein
MGTSPGSDCLVTAWRYLLNGVLVKMWGLQNDSPKYDVLACQMLLAKENKILLTSRLSHSFPSFPPEEKGLCGLPNQPKVWMLQKIR